MIATSLLTLTTRISIQSSTVSWRTRRIGRFPRFITASSAGYILPGGGATAMNRNRPANGAEPKRRKQREHITGSPSGGAHPATGRGGTRCAVPPYASCSGAGLRGNEIDEPPRPRPGRRADAIRLLRACAAQFDSETPRPPRLPMKRLSTGNTQDGGLHPPYACCSGAGLRANQDVGRMQSASFARAPGSSMVKLLVRPVSP